MRIIVDLDKREDRKEFEQFIEARYGDGLFSKEVKNSRVSNVIDKVKKKTSDSQRSQKSTRQYFKDNPREATYDMMGKTSTVQDIAEIVYGDDYDKNHRAAVYRSFEGLVKNNRIKKLNTKNGQPNVYRKL